MSILREKLVLSRYSITNLLFSLFFLVLIIDPADRMLKVKLPLFGVVLFFSILSFRQRTSKTGIYAVISIFCLCLLTSLFGFFRSHPINWEFAVSVYKGFIMMFLLLWVRELDLISKLKVPVLFISSIVVLTYVAMLFFPAIEQVIYLMTWDEDSVLPMIMSRREFLGINFISAYYKTSPLCLFTAALALYQLLYQQTNRFANIIILSLTSFVLFASGTRMNMLTIFLLFVINIIYKISRYKYGKILSVFLFFGAFFFSVALLYLLLNDTGEESLNVKNTLSQAFYNAIDKDPLMLIFGHGVGATFDSLGIRGPFAVQSELTYQDMIRWFGIPSFLLVMMIYLYPLYLLYQKRKVNLPLNLSIASAYLLYLCVAGTNPLLVNSTGMVALLITYSYTLRLGNAETNQYEGDRSFTGHI